MAASSYRFRTSLAGFNKGDVTAYIEKTATQHRSELLERESKIAELQEEIRALTQQMSLLMMAMPAPSVSATSETKEEPETQTDFTENITEENETTENTEAVSEEEKVAANDAETETVTEETAEEEPEISSQAEITEEAAPDEKEEETASSEKEEPSPAACAEEAETATAENKTTDLAELVSLELQAYRRAEAAERNANTRARVVYRELEDLCDNALDDFKAADDAMKQTIETITEKAAELEKAYKAFSSALSLSREKIAFIDKQYPSSDNEK